MTEETPNTGQSMSRQEVERAVVARAQSDPAFRQRLLADPREALRDAFGIEVPPEVQVQVLEETGSTVYLVLPQASDALTDEQLAAVAGGLGAEPVAMQGGHNLLFYSASVRMR